MMENKRALVTGASSVIGFQIARDFLDQGAFVGAHYRSNKSGAKGLSKFGKPGHCQTFQADFSESKEVLRLWDEFMAWSGGIDILVNNAGAAANPVPINELSEWAWDNTFQVNVKAAFLLGRAALSQMQEQKSGRIISISSIGLKFGGGINTVHYSASKAALEAVTASLAKAGAPYHVLVNTVRAGVTDTPMHEKIGRTDMSDRASLIPLKRLALPSEISQAVQFLAGDKSSFVTGSVLTVSGGE